MTDGLSSEVQIHWNDSQGMIDFGTFRMGSHQRLVFHHGGLRLQVSLYMFDAPVNVTPQGGEGGRPRGIWRGIFPLGGDFWRSFLPPPRAKSIILIRNGRKNLFWPPGFWHGIFAPGGDFWQQYFALSESPGSAPPSWGVTLTGAYLGVECVYALPNTYVMMIKV